jgi:hypothetical protein
LEGGVHPGTSGIHDSWAAFLSDVEDVRVVKPEPVSELVCSSSGTQVKVFRFEISAIAAKSIHERNITEGMILYPEKIVCRISV